ncbi:helix-turn-helix domain-containing protein [Ochrobactrum sp. CGA5]|uniref:helix-turn-helix domain-containing protein n=1 Tax=Ochrobactrum sp. CGA5 TaxID=2583453 RepID=UPI001FFFD398|nr:helix-turn-helix domain-containing protein [Ochrobactrum sp. CGA5]
MFAAAYSRNTDRAAKALIAKRNADRIEAERERKEQLLLEAKRREQERKEAERKRQEIYRNIIASYREVGIRNAETRLSIRDIISDAVAGSSFTHDDVVGARRTRSMSNIRHFAVLSAWAFRPDMSLPAIGRHFGGRDHTTILHSVNLFGFESREQAAAFISLHGREATMARLSKQAA